MKLKRVRRGKLNRPNIGLVTYATTYHKSTLPHFVTILKPLSNELFVITGTGVLSEKQIFDKAINPKNVQNSTKESKWVLVRIVRYVLAQMKVSVNLMKISKNIELVILFLGGSALILPMLTAKLLKKKVILVVSESVSKDVERMYSNKLFGTGGFIFYHIMRILEEINYMLSDRIVLYSKSIIYSHDLERYTDKILPFGVRFVDIDLFKIKKRISERKNVIGFIGRFREEKGIREFVDAIPFILQENKDVKFLIAGDGALFEEIKDKIETNVDPSKVKLVGWIPHEELPEYLNELKLFVLPSCIEGMPNIVFEAMSCGTPVLATPVGGVPDVIRNEETGFILENNSPKTIAKSVTEILKYSNIDDIVKKARKLLEEKYTYKAAVERYRKIIQNIL